MPPLRPDADVVRLRARLLREKYEAVMAVYAKLANVKDPMLAQEQFGALSLALAEVHDTVEAGALVFEIDLSAAVAELRRAREAHEAPDPAAAVPPIITIEEA